MEKLIGNKIEVHFKWDEIVEGVIFDIDDQHIYIQSNNVVVVIPKINIKYYTAGMLKPEKPSVLPKSSSNLEVYVDGVIVANIPVAPGVDLSSFNDHIMKIALGDSKVQVALQNKVQRQIEYDVGCVNIATNNISASSGSTNTFTMGDQMSSMDPYDIITKRRSD